MNDFKKAFMAYMDANDVKYTEPAEESLRIIYTGDSLKSIRITVFFDERGSNIVGFDSFDIARFQAEKIPAGMIVCNTLNARYRWVKFFLDDDYDIRCQMDCYVEMNTCGEMLMSLVRRMVSIIDEAYPDLMKAQWGN